MGNSTSIEWTDATWNPIRGCSRVSEGCRNCYAERVAHRFSGAGQPYDGLTQLVNGHPVWTGQVKLVEEHLLDPLKWKQVSKFTVLNPQGVKKGHVGVALKQTRSRRIFVNSMSDLFHPNVPDEWIDRIFAVMALCPQHTFQILTKRPERMLAYLTNAAPPNSRRYVHTVVQRVQALVIDFVRLGKFQPNGFGPIYAEHREAAMSRLRPFPLSNVQLGVSVENQPTADERIPLLLQTPATVRFISAEPLLDAIDLSLVRGNFARHALSQVNYPSGKPWLDWVICGGESGPGARPMHPNWARSLRDQCQAAGVPFFFKQWGEWEPVFYWGKNAKAPLLKVSVPDSQKARPRDREIIMGDAKNAVNMQRVGKKANGSLLDGREWKEFPRCQ